MFFGFRRLIENFFRVRLPVVHQPQQLKTLDDLRAQAAHYAKFCMRNGGKLSPTLFLIGADGPMMFVPTSLADENEKDAFATTARLMCIAYAATVAVMALEAWMKTAISGETFDITEPPSESFDRQEVVVLMGEAQGSQSKNSSPSSAAATENSLASTIPTCRAWTKWKAVSPESCRRKWPPTRTGLSPKQCCRSKASSSPSRAPRFVSSLPATDFHPDFCF